MDRMSRTLLPMGIAVGAILVAVGLGRGAVAEETVDPPPASDQHEMASPETDRPNPGETEGPTAGLSSDEFVGRAFDLGARLGEIERKLVELESMEPAPEREARLEALHAAANEIRAERERLERVAGQLWGPWAQGAEKTLAFIDIEHREAMPVAEIVAQFLSGDSQIAADPGTNTIILFARGAAIDRARRIVQELDAPVPREARVPYGSESGLEAPARRLYDYELGADPGVAREELMERAPKPFHRTTGQLVDRSATSITVSPDDADGPQAWQLPQVQVGDQEWRVRERVQRTLDGLSVGDRVVLEWWEADGVRYVEGLSPMKRKPEETYILGD